MPTDSTDRAAAKKGWEAALGVGRGAAPVGDARDLLGRALELLVGEHRGALEGEVARDLEERAAASVVVPDLDRHGPRDPVRAQEQHVERVPALPRQPLLGVVRRPHVEGRELLDRTAVRDGPGSRDLRPGADPYPVGLVDAAVLRQRVRRRLALGPHALLEGAAELGLVGLAHQVTTLVVERRVEEEAVVLDLEVLVGLADAALAERDELLALGERAHSDSPFLESDWHRSVERGWIGTTAYCPISPGETPSDETSHTMHKVAKSHNSPAKQPLSSNIMGSERNFRAVRAQSSAP